MSDPDPKFKWGTWVRLVRDTLFFRGVRERKRFPEGTKVKIQQVETVWNDHGHFSYHLYHLRTSNRWDYWRAQVMHYEIEPVTVLDRLANL